MDSDRGDPLVGVGTVIDDNAHDRRLLCAACGVTLTAARYATCVNGRERHVATNPAGYTYRMRTFDAAPGCTALGTPEPDHSWFPPHAWQVACCGGCGVHCGWRFSGRAAAIFFALIEDCLREDDGP